MICQYQLFKQIGMWWFYKNERMQTGVLVKVHSVEYCCAYGRATDDAGVIETLITCISMKIQTSLLSGRSNLISILTDCSRLVNLPFTVW